MYLPDEIHSDWRQKLKEGCESNDSSILFISAVTDHQASDSARDLLGAEDNNFWRDHKSANNYLPLNEVFYTNLYSRNVGDCNGK